MNGVFFILLQFLCLLVTAAGWGVGVWLITGRPDPLRRGTWLWCGLAGFCAHALVLQGLIYLDLPLSRTAWPAFGLAWIGVIAGIWLSRRSTRISVCSERKDLRLLLSVLAIVVAGAASGILWVGLPNYFGKGRYDQANYVVTAQFLVDRPFSSTVHDVGLHPWMVRALETKEQRITQSVAHGALAVVSGTDCQQAYGAITAFFLGLTALAVTAWLRGNAVPSWLAAIGGVGAALGPALSTLQLDGYFSQTSTLFVFPALATLLLGRSPLPALHRLAAALLLAFWIGAYTEVALVGAAAVVAIRLAAGGPWRTRLADVGWIGAGALVLNPGYAVRLAAFLSSQLSRAQDPRLLAALFPDGGTWVGWGRLFLDLGPGRLQTAAIVAAGGLVLLMMLCGVLFLPRRRRWLLWATLFVPVALLAWLALQPVLPKYAFGKLTAGFAPLWAGTAVLGLVALGRLRRSAQAVLAILALGAGVASTLPHYARLVRHEGALAELNSPGMQRVRAEVRQHPERTYLVASDHPLVAQWLCYFARNSSVYLDRRNLGDRIVPSENHAFRQLPDASVNLWWLDLDREGPVTEFQPACRLRVTSTQREESPTGGAYYVSPDGLRLEIERPSNSPAVESRWLNLVCIPASGSQPFALDLVGENQSRQRAVLNAAGPARFRLALAPGKNRFTLALAPGSPANGEKPALIFQSLSLDPVTAVELAGEPVPARNVP